MSVESGIRRLRVKDAAALVTLRREALENEPLAFASFLEDDRGSLEFIEGALADHEEQAVFGLFEELSSWA